MHKQSKYYSRFAGQVVPVIILMICLTGLSGCGGTYGRLSVNSDVKALFERNEILSDYRYYHSGLAPHPRVIMGLHKDYTLQSEYWTPVELSPEKLNRWLRFQAHRNKFFLSNNGSDIFDAGGRNIGIWYGLSGPDDRAVVKMIDDKTVNITPPIPRREKIRPLFMRPY
jgi:hypothetical protein